MDRLEEAYLKNLVLHLEDISKSLQVISGRMERSDDDKPRRESYKSKYFAMSEDK